MGCKAEGGAADAEPAGAGPQDRSATRRLRSGVARGVLRAERHDPVAAVAGAPIVGLALAAAVGIGGTRPDTECSATGSSFAVCSRGTRPGADGQAAVGIGFAATVR